DKGVALTTWVARPAPFSRTTELETKLLPVRVSVNPGLPAETLEGEMLESEGTGLLTVRVTAEEVPPPGAGLETVMDRLAPAVKSDAGIDAVNSVALTNVVARPAPLTRTTELETKLLPVRVSVNPGLPAELFECEMLESEGTGLLTVRVTAEEVPPPGAGLETVMDRLAPTVKSDGGSAGVNC